MEKVVKTVFDAFEMIDADVVVFLDKNGVEIPDEQLDDRLRVLSVTESEGVAKVNVNYTVR